MFAVLVIAYTAQQRDIQTLGSDISGEAELLSVDGMEETETAEPEDRGVTVILDAGHGGKDQGCAYGGIIEKNINLEIALLLEQKLEAAGIHVVMTRDDDTFVYLNRRVEAAENAAADAFISIHVDSYPEDESINGVTIHYETGADGGRELANMLHTALGGAEITNVRRVMESDLYVLRNTSMPATLVEAGFLTNSTDRANLQSEDFLDGLAEGIYEGIVTFFEENAQTW
jgi:N-acetylmuramoyl-L-alanine amidase